MDDEFDKLMNILSEDAEEKEKKLEQIFQRCSDFFEYYKKVMREGSAIEKESILLKMNMLREKLKAENQKAQSALGLSKDELKQIACKPENFTKEQWEFLKEAENRINIEKAELEEKALAQKEVRMKELKSKVKGRQNRKSGWMKT
jgi:hypothetical protein